MKLSVQNSLVHRFSPARYGSAVLRGFVRLWIVCGAVSVLWEGASLVRDVEALWQGRDPQGTYVLVWGFWVVSVLGALFLAQYGAFFQKKVSWVLGVTLGKWALCLGGGWCLITLHGGDLHKNLYGIVGVLIGFALFVAFCLGVMFWQKKAKLSGAAGDVGGLVGQERKQQ